MKTRHYTFLIPLLVLMALLTVACSSDTATDNEQPLPEGMGRLRITICTPEANPDLTRAVGDPVWEDPDHEWECLQTYHILICKPSISEEGKYEVVYSYEESTMNDVESDSYPYKQSDDIILEVEADIPYYIFATANYDDGYDVGDVIDPNQTVRFPFGLSKEDDDYTGISATDIPFGAKRNIPMTGKLASPVTVSAGSTADATITVWRVMAKMQFNFTNESSEEIQIMGIEVEPINTNASDQGLIYLFSKDDLTDEDNLAVGGVTLPATGVTTGSVSYEIPSSESPEILTPLLTLAAKNDEDTDDEGTLFFYVNETDATFTMTQNQYSLRFKIKRGGTISELRYGVTTHYGDGSTGQDGFNVIRRNDWIHIPIHLTDWQYRIEPLPFVPIGGYPAATVSSDGNTDGLTATFSTGGMIALQPFIKKRDVIPDTWLDFGDSRITYGKTVNKSDGVTPDEEKSWEASIQWKNKDGDTQSGNGKIVKTPFAYDPVSKCIIGELNQNEVGHGYMTTFTVYLKLKGPEDPETPGAYIWYDYTFTFNIVLQ